MKIVLIGILLNLAMVFGKPAQKAEFCDYTSCHEVDPTKLNIHLVAHSHDDVGWLKTVDQYYYGARNYIQQAGVQHIIGSVVDALSRDSNRRFIQVETAFFWQWWKDQSEVVQEATRELVASGRLEITNGAWSMNDEAAAHYHSIIDQFTWGLRILNDTLGTCSRPKIGWQIDPFGHSKEMASIFSQIGYEAMFFARLDHRDNRKRHDERNLEMIWQGSADLGNSSNIFTSVLYDFYTAPAYFCWDVLCTDTPVVDDESSPEYNLEQMVEDFAAYAIAGAENFRTKNLLITMGGDFTYQAAEMYFVNMDRLIAGFKKFRPDINIIYSTPSCYVKAINDIAQSENMAFQLKTDDFFPYASDAHSYWTGYFTSRPNSKRNERTGNNMLQVMKQLVTFQQQTNVDYSSDLILLKEAMGIMQHHDAITGTEKQHVAQDYARIVTQAIKSAETNVENIIVNLLKTTDNVDDVSVALGSCLLSNVTYCAPSSAERFVVTVYNPLSRNVSHYVRLPVNGDSFIITGPNGDVGYTLLPAIGEFDYIDFITPRRTELVFLARDIPPLGIQYYYVDRSVFKKGKKAAVTKRTRLGTAETGFEIDDTTGLLSSVTLNGVTLPVSQNFMYYNGANGTNGSPETRASGAYIFRPADTTPEAVPFTSSATYTVYTTDLVDEVHQVFNSWIRQIIRVYKQDNYIEFDWLVGPIEIINGLGVEVVTRFTTDLITNGIFYTDANGRQMVRRIRNFRETYEYTDEEPVSGNYYPVTSKITLKDATRNLELAVLNDRAQGGASLADGQLELMVHRRLLNDDNFGVGEALNEEEFEQGVVVRGQHYLTLGSMAANPDGRTSAAQQRDLAARKLLAPWVFVGDASASTHSLDNLRSKLNFQFSGLARPLPENVQILTLEPWGPNTLLFRLEHTLETTEDSALSQPVSVSLVGLFTLFDIVTVEEMNLGANVPKDEINRMQWNTFTEKKSESVRDVETPVVLNPMEIRTFVITVSPGRKFSKRN